ncbi:MAG TPA: flagellar hook-basal body complex protein FliE [Pseudacidobacterium sp.]|jgi:flagellar hook-basal body complex protein FliE|nr:flagellar hook-basal body complex protein FliE [Pseudacidobacterium sp.]
MQTNSIATTSTIASLPDSSTHQTDVPAAPFAGLFQDAMQNMQQLEDKASQAIQGLLDGSGVDVHTAMIATSDADAAFELALSVRNKGMAAFQQLMNMQF